MSINWWTSLVPAPAVIPAPIAYINAAAVKKLVVGSRVAGCTVALLRFCGLRSAAVAAEQPCALDLHSFNTGTEALQVGSLSGAESAYASTIRIRAVGGCYCEQTSVSKAGFLLPCMFEHGITRNRSTRFFLLVFNPRRKNSVYGVSVGFPISSDVALIWAGRYRDQQRLPGLYVLSASEVKFFYRGKTNFCESIRQECLH